MSMILESVESIEKELNNRSLKRNKFVLNMNNGQKLTVYVNDSFVEIEIATGKKFRFKNINELSRWMYLTYQDKNIREYENDGLVSVFLEDKNTCIGDYAKDYYFGKGEIIKNYIDGGDYIRLGIKKKTISTREEDKSNGRYYFNGNKLKFYQQKYRFQIDSGLVEIKRDSTGWYLVFNKRR